MSKKTCISLKNLVYSTLSSMEKEFKKYKDERLFTSFKTGYELSLIDIFTYMKLSKNKDIQEEIRKIIKELTEGDEDEDTVNYIIKYYEKVNLE